MCPRCVRRCVGGPYGSRFCRLAKNGSALFVLFDMLSHVKGSRGGCSGTASGWGCSITGQLVLRLSTKCTTLEHRLYVNCRRGWWLCLLACWLAGSLAFALQTMVSIGTHGSEIDAVAHWQVRRRCSWAIAIQKLMPMGISSAAKPQKTTSEILATRSGFQIQSPNAIPSAQRSRMCRVMSVSYVLSICAALICART